MLLRTRMTNAKTTHMPSRPRTCDTCNRWIKRDYRRHQRSCRRVDIDEPARKRRRVQEPLPREPMKKVRGTRYLTAKTIKTTKLEVLTRGASRTHLKSKGKTREKRGASRDAPEPTILLMMQIGIKKTREVGLSYELSLLSL